MDYELIIVGAGPAGVTAGIYAARKGLKALVLTKDFLGQISKSFLVENWPGEIGLSGIALAKKFEKHLRRFDIEIRERSEAVEIRTGRAYSVKTADGQSFTAKAVIIATGARPRRLGIEGEERFLGRGVSYCATCDSPFFKNKQAVVIGSGNSGLIAALALLSYVKKIYILEKGGAVAGDVVLEKKVLAKGKVEILFNKNLLKIEGGEKVESVVFEDVKTGKTYAQPMSGVFVSAGTVPNSEFVKGLVRLNRQGEIEVDCRTLAASEPGIFAAGDVTSLGPKQLVVAASQGCTAALSAYKYQ